jgi:hypothetical protein
MRMSFAECCFCQISSLHFPYMCFASLQNGLQHGEGHFATGASMLKMLQGDTLPIRLDYLVS